MLAEARELSITRLEMNHLEARSKRSEIIIQIM